MTDDEGVVISDRQTVIADRTSINASERVFRVRLNLKAGAYDKNKIYRPLLLPMIQMSRKRLSSILTLPLRMTSDLTCEGETENERVY